MLPSSSWGPAGVTLLNRKFCHMPGIQTKDDWLTTCFYGVKTIVSYLANLGTLDTIITGSKNVSKLSIRMLSWSVQSTTTATFEATFRRIITLPLPSWFPPFSLSYQDSFSKGIFFDIFLKKTKSKKVLKRQKEDFFVANCTVNKKDQHQLEGLWWNWFVNKAKNWGIEHFKWNFGHQLF